MREDRLNYIEKEISKTPLYSLLGADGIGELKSRIIDIICDQIQKDLRDSSYYLISQMMLMRLLKRILFRKLLMS